MSAWTSPGSSARPAPASTVHGGRRIRTFSANPDAAVLTALVGLVTYGAVRPVVHSVYSLMDIAAAHQAFVHGGGLGKHVLTVSR
ncbi:zinc-binding dehydrogenase [Amycolatopsis sp. cmx-4-68]|uniref:zinc-binding dehydrogenase n=1 Tax=Amycolatopsis sp. cmx-4-68 TaxID=2790938 RepID=UPI0039794B66